MPAPRGPGAGTVVPDPSGGDRSERPGGSVVGVRGALYRPRREGVPEPVLGPAGAWCRNTAPSPPSRPPGSRGARRRHRRFGSNAAQPHRTGGPVGPRARVNPWTEALL